MKYTVVIRQSVPDEVRPLLEQQLVERFGLSAEQAERLAARRSGRLMKPTGRARADLLLRVFQDVGAQVALEEVREETGVLEVPFQAAPATPVTVRAVPDPEGGVALAPPLTDFAAFGAPGARRESSAARTGESLLEPALQAPEPGVLTLPADDAWADLAADPFAPAALNADPFAAAVTPAALPDGLAASPFGDVPPAAPPSGTAGQPPAATPDSSDIWSDFTGALTLQDAKPQEEAQAAAPETFLTALADETRGPLGRRRSLARQMTFGALAPLALSTALTLGLLTAILPSLQRQLVQQNAEAVAVAVGTSLDTRDQETVNAQLDALLKRSAVGFVRVELPDGTTYFRSQNPQLDGTLQGRVAAFLKEHPETGTLVTSGSAADAYREQLKQLEDVGAGDSPQARELRNLAQNRDNQHSERTSYVVSRLGVMETGSNQRTTAPATEDSSDLLYRIAVGVPTNEAQANLRNTLLLVLGVSLLALLLAAALAVRSARRVVQPIERLVKVADAISMGDLTRPVQADRNDEIGDLAQALERMRLSLESAMDRLRRRKRG
ncbi:HAMP domain-containing protein [Deinococcus metallilatus]|uniref:histidine kinase n=1 Tax=Deinococcus metallilatus TaxID=1211322 RepID=A0AAJ5F2T5_9DEIO|nr:HAMP domain-containing protein [Deinococcus metallilatus]MBB5296519.1 HAMP domain-containing protein [Deinococcus metallilatus]QBY08450.1 HAMP domain-containing protein [Deinococcus metallilatus]RXJ11249.1 HAMP domain-containing protein [Deinococcus metallilatus]TLK24740.1 HAMP domain-containing protein [Deinococcus metallilatus]GMA17437.1 HAMP domain-containing protein [Deinococcus metallilatus]